MAIGWPPGSRSAPAARSASWPSCALEPGPKRQVLNGRDTPATRSTAEQIAGLPELRRQLEAEGSRAHTRGPDPGCAGRAGEAEKKAAVVLGLDPRRVAVLSLRLWGRSLTAEREARFDQQEPKPPAPDRSAPCEVTSPVDLIAELRAASGGQA